MSTTTKKSDKKKKNNPRNTRTYKVKDPIYFKALNRKSSLPAGRIPLATILESVVTYRAAGFSILAKRNGKTIEIVG